MKLATYLKRHKVSQAQFGQQVGVSQGMVWQWLNDKRRVSAEKVLPIELATNGLVTRHELRSDIYPRDAA